MIAPQHDRTVSIERRVKKNSIVWKLKLVIVRRDGPGAGSVVNFSIPPFPPPIKNRPPSEITSTGPPPRHRDSRDDKSPPSDVFASGPASGRQLARHTSARVHDKRPRVAFQSKITVTKTFERVVRNTIARCRRSRRGWTYFSGDTCVWIIITIQHSVRASENYFCPTAGRRAIDSAAFRPLR